MKKVIVAATAFLVLVSVFTGCKTLNSNSVIDKTTVGELDISRYLGTWYEIGRFDHAFEKNLVGVTATYTLKNDGMIEVLNRGYYKTPGGEPKTACGKARITGQPGKLKVSFFLFFYAEYNILDLDREAYQWALVGSSTSKYLWILARTPGISDDLYDDILQKAAGRGYDIKRIYKVPQKL